MYAPAPHPKLAMAVYMEKTGGYGASVAGIVAQHIVADYFGVKIAPIGP
jgi:cell division protein FtsI/penicillin-binding protein 2